MIKANGIGYNPTKGFWVALLTKLTAPLKISFVVGSYAAFFSLSHCLIPLIGAYTNMPVVLAFGLLSMLMRYAFGTLVGFKIAAFYLPGMVAGLAWIKEYRAVQLLVPALCMALFIAHPVGGAAWAYTLYWLIPMIIYSSNRQSLFAQALASTLVAHAVGATIWLYADPMNPAVWLGLIPVVAYERVLFAVGMTATHMALSQLGNRLQWTRAITIEGRSAAEELRY